MDDLFARARGRALAEEKYPEPAHGPNRTIRRYVVDAFVDGYASRAEFDANLRDLWEVIAENLEERGAPKAAEYVRNHDNADAVYERYIDPLLSDIIRDFPQSE